MREKPPITLSSSAPSTTPASVLSRATGYPRFIIATSMSIVPRNGMGIFANPCCR